LEFNSDVKRVDVVCVTTLMSDAVICSAVMYVCDHVGKLTVLRTVSGDVLTAK